MTKKSTPNICSPDKRYEAEDAARVLVRAQEIRADKDLFGRAKGVLAKQREEV